MVHYNDNNPALGHSQPTLHATAAAAIAAGIKYKGIWFSVAGTVNVVDVRSGEQLSVAGGVGSCYPVQNWGVVTGGTLTNTQFLLLRD